MTMHPAPPSVDRMTASRIDPLTGLCNLRAIAHEITRQLDECRHARLGYGLLLIDIDRLRTVNERLGPQAGDLLLRRLARCLETSGGRSNTCARAGSDEFVLTLPRADEGEVERQAAIIRAEAEQISIPGVDPAMTPEIRVAAAVAGRDGCSIDELLAAAHERMARRPAPQ